MSGYTEQEKYEIAKRHLLPKQMKINCLEKHQLRLSAGAIYGIIRNYTREAGVRRLERELARLCRKVVLRITENEEESISVTVNNLSKFLGNQRYHYDKVDTEDPIGVVTGLAWTAVGGDTLTIEVSATSGTGKLNLTGSLGDVMKESAQVALAMSAPVKMCTKKAGLPDKTDIHIHVPEAPCPRTDLLPVSRWQLPSTRLDGKPVHHDLAMTGEITIRVGFCPSAV